jgi:hypothetical protein
MFESFATFHPAPASGNKIEHRLFSFITQNWFGKPLISLEVIVNLSAATTTEQDYGFIPNWTNTHTARRQSVRRRTGSRQSPTRQVPWRLELSNPATRNMI